MVINIGQDCWDIIMRMKFEMEKAEHKKKYEKCMGQLTNTYKYEMLSKRISIRSSKRGNVICEGGNPRCLLIDTLYNTRIGVMFWTDTLSLEIIRTVRGKKYHAKMKKLMESR